MAVLRQDGPYIWVTWLTKLLVGENSCEWAAWFRARHEGWSWERQPSTFDPVVWQMDHSAQVSEVRGNLEEKGHAVFTEEQNRFVLRGKSAKLAGKPDLIAKRGEGGVVIDVKTGRPSPSHSVQVMLYMYAIPRSLGHRRGIAFDGKVLYEDHEVDIPATAVDEKFISNVSDLIRRLASEHPARKVPSGRECSFCNITAGDCPERMDADDAREGVTADF